MMMMMMMINRNKQPTIVFILIFYQTTGTFFITFYELNIWHMCFRTNIIKKLLNSTRCLISGVIYSMNPHELR